MNPIIDIVRHAEGYHNVTTNDSLVDPVLTPRGRSQCLKLRSDYAPHGHKVVCVLASPMQRTIETALYAFGPFTGDRKIVLLPDLQEPSLLNCNTGSSREVLEAKFGTDRLDFSLVEPGWDDKSLDGRNHQGRARARANAVRLYIRAIARYWRDRDVRIVVVSHYQFIPYMTLRNNSIFSNAEWRSYEYQHLHGSDLDASLIEMPLRLVTAPGAMGQPVNYSNESLFVADPVPVPMAMPMPPAANTTSQQQGGTGNPFREANRAFREAMERLPRAGGR